MVFYMGIYISICIFAVYFVMMTVNKLKIIRFMKELVKRLSGSYCRDGGMYGDGLSVAFV